MKLVTPQRVHELVTDSCGLDPTVLDIETVEVIAGLLRRAAGLLCPCHADALIRTVFDTCSSLVANKETFYESIETTLDLIIAHGDLFELQTGGYGVRGHSRFLIYLVPPSFVQRTSDGTIQLLGVLPDNLSLLPDAYSSQIEHVNYTRVIYPTASAPNSEDLIHLGFSKISLDSWTKAPPPQPSGNILSSVDSLLDRAEYSGAMELTQILDPRTSIRYYRGRWVPPDGKNGRYIARRRQAFGAPLWCYVELENGTAAKFVDLPLSRSKWRACDDAWMVQAAIDKENNQPQLVVRRKSHRGQFILDFLSPLPAWALRRLLAIGKPATARNCLFSVALHEGDVDEEISFLNHSLWMESYSETDL